MPGEGIIVVAEAAPEGSSPEAFLSFCLFSTTECLPELPLALFIQTFKYWCLTDNHRIQRCLRRFIWLPGRDSNPDNRLQRPVCCRCTTRKRSSKLYVGPSVPGLRSGTHPTAGSLTSNGGPSRFTATLSKAVSNSHLGSTADGPTRLAAIYLKSFHLW